MKIELRKVKFHEDMSDETNCFSAEVYVDGKRVATAQNQGCGGNTMVHPVTARSDPAFKAFEAHCLSLPPTKHDCGGHKFEVKSTPDSVVDDLFEVWLKAWYDKKEAAQIKRWCRTQTVWRCKGDPEGRWNVRKVEFTPVVAKVLREQLGDTLEEIANERFQTAAG